MQQFWQNQGKGMFLRHAFQKTVAVISLAIVMNVQLNTDLLKTTTQVFIHKLSG